MNPYRMSRRQALSSMAGASFCLSSGLASLAAEKKRRFWIGACDWSIGRGGQPEALALAAEIGLDGVQVSFGAPGEATDLRDEENRQKYLKAAQQHDVQIASLAIGKLNSVPYATEPQTEQWVLDCIQVMPKLKVQVVLLAFFGQGDIKGKPELQDEVIRRLKRAAPKAEQAGVVLGIESWMDVNEHLRILDAVDSPAVQVYYDVANMEQQGYDIYQEIRQLGRERICEIHCKENGFLLGQGRVDFKKVKKAVDEIGWSGWLIIEGAVGGGKTMFDSYVHNQQYLRSVFATEG